MKIMTTDTHKIYTIELRSWNGFSWSPDCFDDLEPNFPASHESSDIYTLAADQEVQNMISWWQDEVDSANEDPDYEGDGLCANGMEWSLDVESEDDDVTLYAILPEFHSLWGSEVDEDTTVTYPEIVRLAREWGKTVEELLQQVEEI